MGNHKQTMKKNRGLGNAGTTMVEVLVAFIVVMIMLGMFTKVVSVSVHMLNQSRDTVRKIEAFDRNYYQTGSGDTMKSVEGTDKLAFTLDEEKTNSKNKAEWTENGDLRLARGTYMKYEDEKTGMTRYSFVTVNGGAGQ